MSKKATALDINSETLRVHLEGALAALKGRLEGKVRGIKESDLRKDYGMVIVKFGDEEYVPLADAAQIVDDYVERRNLHKPKYWKELVEVYYNFYMDKFGAKPDFTGQQPKTLKAIIEKMERSAEQISMEWTKDNAVKEFEHILSAAYDDKWLKENFMLANINIQYQKLRDTRVKEVMYFEHLKKCYVDFYKSKFRLEPDLSKWEIEDLKGIIEKLRNTAEQNKKAWTEEMAEKYLMKMLTLAYEDKWVKEHYLLAIIHKQFQYLRDNERARQEQGTKKGGRIGEEGVSDFLTRRKAHTDSQANS